MANRVVITGMGWITPLGHDVPSVWSRLLAAETGVGPISRFDASTWSTSFAAEVRDFRLEDFLDDVTLHAYAGLNTRFALAAALQAWQQAGLHRFTGLEPRRMGIYLGSGEGSLDFDPYVGAHLAAWNPESRSVDARKWADVAYAVMDARREVEQEPNMALSHIAARFGCRGPASNCLTACAASTQAIGEAFEIIRRGDAEVMFAGGAHSMIHPLGVTGFIRLTALSSRRETPQTAARPFDGTREGFVMGEGAGMLVLESLEHFQRRMHQQGEGAGRALAEIVGYGSSADAFRITDIQPEGRGAQAAMLQALRQAGINPREPASNGNGGGGDAGGPRPPVHYISAHGTGTQENDSTESAAVKAVFGSFARHIPISSVKSMLGHLIAAAGVVELITCVQAIRTGWLPPTRNLHNPDPECDLDYIPNDARDQREQGVEVCLSNSFGFGGQNDTLAVRRFRV